LHVSRLYFPSKLIIIIISNLILGSFSATMSLLIGYQFHFVTLCIVLILTDIVLVLISHMAAPGGPHATAIMDIENIVFPYDIWER